MEYFAKLQAGMHGLDYESGWSFPSIHIHNINASPTNNAAEAQVPTAAGDLVAMGNHPGFTRQQVIARGEAFVEYAYQHGIYAAGGFDVQGVAPKLLLTQDRQGARHAEGRLPDEEVLAHWLVKRPRGNSAAERKVLRNEAAYMCVVRTLGLRVHADLTWMDDLGHESKSLCTEDRRYLTESARLRLSSIPQTRRWKP